MTCVAPLVSVRSRSTHTITCAQNTASLHFTRSAVNSRTSKLHITNVSGENRHSNRHTSRSTRKCNMRSKIRWFTEFCNSHYVSHFAAFFIVARTKTSIAESCNWFIKKFTRAKKEDHTTIKYSMILRFLATRVSLQFMYSHKSLLKVVKRILTTCIRTCINKTSSRWVGSGSVW